MSHCTDRSRVHTAALTLMFFAGISTPFAHAATTSDQPGSGQKQQPAKAMNKEEPMAGEMKKDGMMKEDVGKAAQKWDAKMNEAMKQEKMK